MSIYHASVDPYDGPTDTYECVACRNRVTDDEGVVSCPECGGRVRNLSVPRE